MFQANIHSFVESDDRIELVLKYLDQAMLELDNMDSLVTSYKTHLNARCTTHTYVLTNLTLLRRLSVMISPTFSLKIGDYKCRRKTSVLF